METSSVDLIREFLNETHDNLTALDDDMLALEREPHDTATLARVFRVLHTIKGSCGFLKLQRLEKIARWGEHLLAYFRDNHLPITKNAVILVLRIVDTVRDVLMGLERDRVEPVGDDAALERAVDTLMASRDKNTLPDDTQRNTPSPQDATIRVSVDAIEDVMNRLSEVILARNDLLTQEKNNPTLLRKVARLDDRVAALQDGILMTRMQPVRRMWQGLPRAVHDIAHALGKEIDLVMTGGDTELDRHILDGLKETFLHLIRNAADHGIESPSERVAAGKKPVGTIRLHAEQKAGRIIITLEDDGRGVDDAIKPRLFTPGFSTATTVTDVSGRGVGLDVVRHDVEKVGGTIVMESQKGAYCRFIFSVPLTLAVIPALLIKIGDHRFAVPQSAVLQLIRMPHIDGVGADKSYLWQDMLIPVIALSDVLRIPCDTTQSILIVMQDISGVFGILVDQVITTQEIIAKPLPGFLAMIGAFSGTTTLGDGSVILMLHHGYFAVQAGTTLHTRAASMVHA